MTNLSWAEAFVLVFAFLTLRKRPIVVINKTEVNIKDKKPSGAFDYSTGMSLE